MFLNKFLSLKQRKMKLMPFYKSLHPNIVQEKA